MGFLKKLFGGGEKQPKEYVDTTGVYFYVQCNNCGKRVKLRADKQHDLLNEGGGYTWHKTIIDSKCFRPMETVVYLDRNYNVTQYDLSGGRFLTEEEYLAAEKEEVVAKLAAEAAAKAEAEAKAVEAEKGDEPTENDEALE